MLRSTLSKLCSAKKINVKSSSGDKSREKWYSKVSGERNSLLIEKFDKRAIKKVLKMKRCQKAVESLILEPNKRQRTTAEEQQCPFLSPTTPAWGDRNVSEQSAEENNSNFGFSFVHSIPSTSNSTIPACNQLSSRSSSSSPTRSLTENTMNNQSPNDATQLPRKCKLCSYVATERTEYVEHVITHCTFIKNSYVENDFLNGYIDDEEDDNSTKSQSKGKKKNKVSKPKPCSKCNFMAMTKCQLWMHLRQHFMQDDCSGFVCFLCPFATTLKHHMTFHWFSAHDDFKGFMCKECSYTCVSKSMLTSHMKTHSEIFQWNCGSCKYKTKFCNAMKKHLKENMHVAGTVLNPDGSPNPFATIDIYGSKRGPKRKPIIEEKNELKEIIEEENMPSIEGMTSSVSLISSSSAPELSIPVSSAVNSDSLNLNTASRSTTVRMSSAADVSSLCYDSLIAATLAALNKTNIENGANSSIGSNINMHSSSPLLFPNYGMLNMLCSLLFKDIAARQNIDEKEHERVVRLLVNAQRFLCGGPGHIEHVTTHSTAYADEDLSDNARIIDEPSTPVSESQSEAEENEISDEPLDLSMSTISKKEKESIASLSRHSKRKSKRTGLSFPVCSTASQFVLQERNETLNVTHNASFICYYCRITFANEIMYAIHMGFHSSENPLICALCDRKSANVIAFFLHLVRTKH